MPVFNNVLAGASAQATGYDIDQSLRFNDDDSPELVRSVTVAGNRRTSTWSAWVKIGWNTFSNDSGTIEPTYTLFCCGNSDGRWNVGFANATATNNNLPQLFIGQRDSGGNQAFEVSSNQAFRDPSAWYHIVVVMDTTQSTNTNRVKAYVNGERITDWGVTSFPSQNYDSDVFRTADPVVKVRVGGTVNNSNAGANFWDGYIAEVNVVDGTALDASYFGETDSATNQWVPVKYAGSYGTNGFYLPFSSTELATSFTDSSSSSKTITANGDVHHSRSQKKIGNSSIKFDGTGDFLSCADSSDWSFGTGDFTLEAYVRFNDSAGSENLFSQYQDGSNRWYLSADLTNNTLGFFDAGSGMDVEQTVVTWVADTWYHVAMVRSSGTVTYFVDGTAYTVTGTNPNGNITSNTGALQIGQYSTGDNLNGYMDEIRISNSARYTGAFTPTTTEFASDSNTKLLIHSNYNDGLCADSSGNQNDFVPTNIVAIDQVLDSPSNSFATLNPLETRGTITLSEGNLRGITGNGDSETRGTIAIPNSGKWYFEFYMVHSTSFMVGLIDYQHLGSGDFYTSNKAVVYSSGLGTVYNFSSVASYGASWTTGDIIGVAVNQDDNQITFYKNNSAQPTLTIGGTAAQRARLIPIIGTGTGGTAGGQLNFGQDSSFAGAKTAQGNGGDGEDFFYTPPTGYKSLATKSLDDPAIADPTAYFDSKLYTGTGSSQSITTGLQPDFSWIKSRSQTASNALFDTIRGATKELISNDSAAEQTFSDSLTAFTSDGFTLGADTSGAHVNVNSQTYVSWNWKAASSNTSVSAGSIDGTNPTIACTRRTNTTAGFSITGFVGNATDGATFGHGLSQKVELAIVKSRDSASKPLIWYDGLSDTQSLELSNSNAIQTSGTPFWDTSSMSASLFALGNNDDTNKSGDNFIAWMWHSVEGYSKVGSYIGNGNADGPFVYTGFTPAFVMIKKTNATENWYIMDNKRPGYNVDNDILYANLNNAEADTDLADLVSGGIKIRTTDSAANTSSGTYIYLAFAESPQKFSNAR